MFSSSALATLYGNGVIPSKSNWRTHEQYGSDKIDFDNRLESCDRNSSKSLLWKWHRTGSLKMQQVFSVDEKVSWENNQWICKKKSMSHFDLSTNTNNSIYSNEKKKDVKFTWSIELKFSSVLENDMRCVCITIFIFMRAWLMSDVTVKHCFDWIFNVGQFVHFFVKHFVNNR